MSHPLLQGSVLQIQGPRGYKGSKGDLVRALKLFLLKLFSNVYQWKIKQVEQRYRTEESILVLSARRLMLEHLARLVLGIHVGRMDFQDFKVCNCFASG